MMINIINRDPNPHYHSSRTRGSVGAHCVSDARRCGVVTLVVVDAGEVVAVELPEVLVLASTLDHAACV